MEMLVIQGSHNAIVSLARVGGQICMSWRMRLVAEYWVSKIRNLPIFVNGCLLNLKFTSFWDFSKTAVAGHWIQNHGKYSC